MAVSKEKQKALAAMTAKINKRFGEGTIATVSEVKDKLTIHRVPTPSLEFNAMLYGGLAEGRIIEFFGPNSSGKTSMAEEIIAEKQRQDPDFVAGWLETEGSVTPEDLAMFGIDMDRLFYFDQRDAGNAENALDIYRSVVASGAVDMLVTNSIAGLVPKTETEEDLDKQNMALMARLMSKFFRVVTGVASKNGITQIFINQVRASMNMYSPETTTGGNALAFWATQRVRFSKKSLSVKEDPITKEEGMKIGCIVHKNRAAEGKNPYTTCDYYVRYGKGIDRYINLPTFLGDAGIVRQSGAYWYYEDSNGKILTVEGVECKFKSRAVFLEALATNPGLKDFFVSKLTQASMTRALSEEEIAEIEDENAKIESEVGAIEKELIGDDIEELFDEKQ